MKKPKASVMNLISTEQEYQSLCRERDAAAREGRYPDMRKLNEKIASRPWFQLEGGRWRHLSGLEFTGLNDSQPGVIGVSIESLEDFLLLEGARFAVAPEFSAPQKEGALRKFIELARKAEQIALLGRREGE